MTSTIVSSSPSFAGELLSPKRRKLHHQQQQQPEQLQEQSSFLLPGLPDDVARSCLSRVDPLTLNSVCHSWRRLLYSPSFPPFLSLYALLLPTGLHTGAENSLQFSCFDPVSSKWVSASSPPPPSPESPPLRLLIRHPSFISRSLPVQSVSVSGKLVLLAATTDNLHPALPRPLIFDPLSQSWSAGPPLASPRRWCAVGTLGNSVLVASGIGSHYKQEIAKSVERWDLQKYDNTCRNSVNWRRNRNSTSGSSDFGWIWEKMGPMRDVKFSREAILAVGWRGKLCMVNVKGVAAKEGVIYDLETDEWNDMPDGMLAGWRGPAAAMDEETIYVVDESRGVLRKYNPGPDAWDDLFLSEKLKGAEQITASGGRICVICHGGVEIVVVDVMASPPQLKVVDTPPRYEAVAIHILPRMSQPESESAAVSRE